MKQFQLFELTEVEHERDATPEERFLAFHRANPLVYAAIVNECKTANARGYRVGMKAIFENMRWRWRRKTFGSEYKLNNNFTALYARMVMEREDGLAGFFNVRERSAA